MLPEKKTWNISFRQVGIQPTPTRLKSHAMSLRHDGNLHFTYFTHTSLTSHYSPKITSIFLFPGSKRVNTTWRQRRTYNTIQSILYSGRSSSGSRLCTKNENTNIRTASRCSQPFWAKILWDGLIWGWLWGLKPQIGYMNSFFAFVHIFGRF